MRSSTRLPAVFACTLLTTFGLLTGCTPDATSTESSAASVQEGGVDSGMPTRAARDTQEEFGPYQRPALWPQPLPDHEGWTWGSVGAIYAESTDRIWIAMRGELPLPPGNPPFTPYSMIEPSRGNAPATDDNGNRGYERRYHHVLFAVNADGEVVEYWDQHDQLFDVRGGRGPHKIKMSPYDPEKHVWVIDDQLHQIFKFTYDGELVLTLGERLTPGRGPNNFARPTDIAWLPDGTYFISDGYDGTRVAKYDADDNFIMDWGQPPADPENPGPNEFDTVHSIAISSDRRIYVVDRAHARIQVFDEDGGFLFMFSTGERDRSRPYAHEIMRDPQTGEEFIWVVDGTNNRVLKYDLDGNYLYGWGIAGGEPGEFNGPHSITTDQGGNFYTAEVFSGRLQKFVPRPDADPAKLVGVQLREYEPTVE